MADSTQVLDDVLQDAEALWAGWRAKNPLRAGWSLEEANEDSNRCVAQLEVIVKEVIDFDDLAIVNDPRILNYRLDFEHDNLRDALDEAIEGVICGATWDQQGAS